MINQYADEKLIFGVEESSRKQVTSVSSNTARHYRPITQSQVLQTDNSHKCYRLITVTSVTD